MTECIVVSANRRESVHDFALYFKMDLKSQRVNYEGYKGQKKDRPGFPVPDSTLTKWSQLQCVLDLCLCTAVYAYVFI